MSKNKEVIVKIFQKPNYRQVIGLSLIAIAVFQYYQSPKSNVIKAVSAKIEANMVEVSSQTSGIIESIYTNENNFIVAGDDVASIDTSDLEARLIETKVKGLGARAKVNYADADIAFIATQAESIESEFKVVSAMLSDVRGVYDDAKAAAENGGDVLDGFAELEYEVLALERDVRSLNGKAAELIAKQEKVEMSKGQAYAEGLLVAAQVKMLMTENQKYNITSPVTGVISKVNARAGQFVKVGDPIAQVVDVSDLWVTAYIDEKDISKVRIGNRAQVSPKTNENKWFPAVVRSISPVAVKTSGWFNIEKALVPVKLSVKLSGYLQPGLEVDAFLFTEDQKGSVKSLEQGVGES